LSTDLGECQLSQKVREQIALTTALQKGETFIAKRLRRVRDEQTGLTQVVEVAVKIKEWWFISGGKVVVQLRYGAKVIALNAKGDKNSVEVADADEMIVVLKKLDDAIIAGELDAQIQSASDSMRAKFKH
jgi:hypothetical protein